MPPRVFSSVREAWAGVLSGAVVPAPTRRRSRVSCSSAADLSSSAPAGLSRDEGTRGAAADGAVDSKDEEDDGEEPFECSVMVRLNDADEDDSSRREEVDLSALSDEQLRRLRTQDPFLYYSISSVRRRSYRLVDDDLLDVDIISMARSARRRRRTSMPARMLADGDMNAARSRHGQQLQGGQAVAAAAAAGLNDEEEDPDIGTVVVRRDRRLSTEAHPTLVCDEIMRELAELDLMGGDDDDEGNLDLGLLEEELGL